jgi:hypothetical protein
LAQDRANVAVPLDISRCKLLAAKLNKSDIHKYSYINVCKNISRRTLLISEHTSISISTECGKIYNIMQNIYPICEE